MLLVAGYWSLLICSKFPPVIRQLKTVNYGYWSLLICSKFPPVIRHLSSVIRQLKTVNCKP